jgi:putative FmdB family regulatory protein
MPIYEYACQNCDHTLDALQKMEEEPLVYCPSCGQAGLKKLISAPRFRLKGEGWYETDFKKDNQRNLLKSDSESAKVEKSGKEGDSKSSTKGAVESRSKKSSDKKADSKVDSS